jgi:4-carboxymuconolactone decarboxylase
MRVAKPAPISTGDNLMDDKRNLGHAKFKELSPTGEESIRTLLGDTAPGTYRQILEVAFGDLYQRQNLDPKIRQTVALVALAAGGHERELRIHIDIARTLGFTKGELSEVFQQMAPFTGFPGPILGVRILREEFEG